MHIYLSKLNTKKVYKINSLISAKWFKQFNAKALTKRQDITIFILCYLEVFSVNFALSNHRNDRSFQKENHAVN